jgi:hypothetical protein
MNARLGRGGPLWTTGGPDNVELHGPLTIEQQLLYAWTNPVKDGLCEWPEEWAAAGLMFLPEDWGKTFTFRKPEGAFFGGRRPEGRAPTDPDALADWQAALRAEARDAERLGRERDRARRERERANAKKQARRGGRGCSEKQRRQLERARARRKKKEAAPKPARASRSILPEFVQVTPMPPPGHEHQPLEEVQAHYRKLLDERVEQIHAERRQRGLTTFIGVERIRQEDPREPAGDSVPTFARNPRIACRDRETRLDLLRELQRWRTEVAEKREKWRLGDRDVVFPAGVYGMWALHGAKVVGLVPYGAPSSPRPPPQKAA